MTNCRPLLPRLHRRWLFALRQDAKAAPESEEADQNLEKERLSNQSLILGVYGEDFNRGWILERTI